MPMGPLKLEHETKCEESTHTIATPAARTSWSHPPATCELDEGVKGGGVHVAFMFPWPPSIFTLAACPTPQSIFTTVSVSWCLVHWNSNKTSRLPSLGPSLSPPQLTRRNDLPREHVRLQRRVGLLGNDPFPFCCPPPHPLLHCWSTITQSPLARLHRIRDVSFSFLRNEL